MKLHEVRVGEWFMYRKRAYRLALVDNNIFHCIEIGGKSSTGFHNPNINVGEMHRCIFKGGPIDGEDGIWAELDAIEDEWRFKQHHVYTLVESHMEARVRKFEYAGVKK